MTKEMKIHYAVISDPGVRWWTIIGDDFIPSNKTEGQ